MFCNNCSYGISIYCWYLTDLYWNVEIKLIQKVNIVREVIMSTSLVQLSQSQNQVHRDLRQMLNERNCADHRADDTISCHSEQTARVCGWSSAAWHRLMLIPIPNHDIAVNQWTLSNTLVTHSILKLESWLKIPSSAYYCNRGRVLQGIGGKQAPQISSNPVKSFQQSKKSKSVTVKGKHLIM